jgi:AraC-like DNA-binding protein
MNRAADLLLNSGKLVKQVAEELRFADAYHFSRAFKKVHGLSPVQFLRGGRRD